MCHQSNHKKTDKMPLDKKNNPKEKEKIYSDVLGSYTGKPVDGIRPVQDADDL